MTQNMQKFIKMKFELKNTKNWKHGMEWTKHGAMSYLKLMSIRLDVLNCIIFIYLCLFGKTIWLELDIGLSKEHFKPI